MNLYFIPETREDCIFPDMAIWLTNLKTLFSILSQKKKENESFCPKQVHK